MDDMSNIWSSSPFVIDKSLHSEVPEEARGLADLLYDSVSTGKIYWNGNYNSAGVICDLFDGPVERVTARLLAPWLAQHNPAPSVLMFHTKNPADFRHNRPCYLSDVNHSAKILTLPRSSKLPHVYGTKTQPLRFQQEDIGLQDILALCTPQSNMDGRERIITTIHYILSQLNESFDLQRFIELVDEEKWTEEGATFMALRQTLLTTLISTEKEDPIFEGSHTVLIDLTDLVLSSTGMDAVLINIVLRNFLETEPATGMIVFDSCQEYIRENSILTRTLESTLRSWPNAPVSMLFSTTNPTTLPTNLLQRMDFVISGDIPSPEWKNLLGRYFLKEARQLGYDLPSEVMVMLPPNSKAVWAKKVDKNNPDFAYFVDPICMPWNDIIPTSLLKVQGSLLHLENSNTEAETSMEIRGTEGETLEGSTGRSPDVITRNDPAAVNLIVPGDVSTTGEAMAVPLEGVAATERPSSGYEITPDLYPMQYRALVEAILAISGGVCNVAVPLFGVGRWYAEHQGVDSGLAMLGFTKLIHTARAAGVIAPADNTKFFDELVTLNLPSKNALALDFFTPSSITISHSEIERVPNSEATANFGQTSNSNNSTSSVNVRLVHPSQYPVKYRSLVEAILEACEGKCGVPVGLGKVGGCFSGRTVANVSWWANFITLVDLGCEAGILMQWESQLVNGTSLTMITLNSAKEEWLESDSNSNTRPNCSITSNLFPPKHRVIVSAILRLSGNQYGYYVDFRLVSSECGDKKANLQPKGWKDAKAAADGALADGHISQIIDGSTRWIALKGSIEGLKSMRKNPSAIAAILTDLDILRAQPMVASVISEPKWRCYMPLCSVLVALQKRQITPPFMLSSVNAELKHHFPYAVGANGYQNIEEYIKAAQEVGLMELDINGRAPQVKLIRRLIYN